LAAALPASPRGGRRRAHGDNPGDGLLASFAARDLDPEAIVDELTIVTGAATEATASGLTSVLERLAHHPELTATDSSAPAFARASASACDCGLSRWPRCGA
jgi:cytochrome P450